MATKGQGSAKEAWPPILGSQLHLGVTIRLPLGSMGSHYHRHMLMTPINSPSVGPMQPSVLKVKGRGTGSGWFVPRRTVTGLLCSLCAHRPCTALHVKSVFILACCVPCAYPWLHSVCVRLCVCTNFCAQSVTLVCVCTRCAHKSRFHMTFVHNVVLASVYAVIGVCVPCL